MNPELCPECKTPWKEAISIYEHFLKTNTKGKATEIAGMFGCTKENPLAFGKDVIGIEIQGGYDGVSFWECQKCGSIFDRWTMKKVKDTK